MTISMVIGYNKRQNYASRFRIRIKCATASDDFSVELRRFFFKLLNLFIFIYSFFFIFANAMNSKVPCNNVNIK